MPSSNVTLRGNPMMEKIEKKRNIVSVFFFKKKILHNYLKPWRNVNSKMQDKGTGAVWHSWTSHTDDYQRRATSLRREREYVARIPVAACPSLQCIKTEVFFFFFFYRKSTVQREMEASTSVLQHATCSAGPANKPPSASKTRLALSPLYKCGRFNSCPRGGTSKEQELDLKKVGRLIVSCCSIILCSI